MSGSSQKLTLKKGAPGDQVEICYALPGKGPTEVEDAPAPARKSKI